MYFKKSYERNLNVFVLQFLLVLLMKYMFYIIPEINVRKFYN